MPVQVMLIVGKLVQLAAVVVLGQVFLSMPANALQSEREVSQESCGGKQDEAEGFDIYK